MKKEKNKKEKIPFETFHYSIKNRKKFKSMMIWSFIIFLIIMICCSIMFYFGSVTWDPEKGLKPIANVQYPYQYALLVLASLICVAAILTWTFWCVNKFKKFYDTQIEYFKSPLFEKNKVAALKLNINKMKKSDLKWYKKMNYINADEKNRALENLKQYKKDCKKKHKKVIYTRGK